MNNYELTLILNPDLSTKFDEFQKKFEKTWDLGKVWSKMRIYYAKLYFFNKCLKDFLDLGMFCERTSEKNTKIP